MVIVIRDEWRERVAAAGACRVPDEATLAEVPFWDLVWCDENNIVTPDELAELTPNGVVGTLPIWSYTRRGGFGFSFGYGSWCGRGLGDCEGSGDGFGRGYGYGGVDGSGDGARYPLGGCT